MHLEKAFNERINADIWILSDSRSSVQPLSACWKHGEKSAVSIIQ